MKTELGWHFARANNCLNYDDGRPIIIGETHTVQGQLELCEWGLHASKRILDALQYAPGPVIYRVRLSGEILIGDDKMCATERTYLWGYDATEILQAFARRCALDVVHLWDPPQIVIDYLKTGDESLRKAAWDAARAAARAAAWDAARDAAWAAAWDAARAAAEDAARAAAEAAAEAAARDAAEAAAWDAAREKQNRRLTSMITAGRR
jgi:hypothetical protein